MTIEKGSTEKNENVGKDENQNEASISYLKNEIERLRSEMANLSSIAQGVGVKSPTTATSDEIANAIVKAQKQANTSYVEAVKIDPDDYLDPAVVFVAHKCMFGIFDDKRFGQAVQPPVNKKIVFNHGSTKVERIGRETFVKPWCSYVCRSKKEAAWLREHSLYGIEFFDSMSSALTSDMKRAKLAADYVRNMEMQTKEGIIGHARKLNIPLGQDISHLRTLVALALAEKAIADEEVKKQERVIAETKEQLMARGGE